MNAAGKPHSNTAKNMARAGLAALLGFALLAGVMLHEHAGRDAQSRKDAMALAFEKEADSWLAHPKAASDFEQALAARDVAAVGVDGTLALYTDRHGRRFSARLIDCGRNCGQSIASRLGELSVSHGFVLTSIEIDSRDRKSVV